MTLAVRGCAIVGDSVPRITSSGSVSRRTTLAVRGRVNVGNSVPWSTASGSVFRGVTLAVRGRVKNQLTFHVDRFFCFVSAIFEFDAKNKICILIHVP